MLPPVCAVTNLAGQNNQCYVKGVRNFVYFVYSRLWHLADIKEILKAQHCFILPVYINAAAKTPKRALIIRETTVMEPPPAARSLPHRSPAEKTGRTAPPHKTFPARSGTPLHRRRVPPWPAYPVVPPARHKSVFSGTWRAARAARRSWWSRWHHRIRWPRWNPTPMKW